MTLSLILKEHLNSSSWLKTSAAVGQFATLYALDTPVSRLTMASDMDLACWNRAIATT